MIKRTPVLILAISIFFSTYFAQAQYTKLHSFSGSTDGKYPWASLYNDGTHLYGMTGEGGPDNDGTIFKLKKDGTGFQTILNFKNADNGSNPYGSLISNGTFLYGLTYSGAATNFGTIFKILPDGTGYVKLHEFTGADGEYLYGSLVTDGSFLYGMTFTGGASDLGTIFKLKTDGSSFSTVLNFAGTSNGQNPVGDLLLIGSTLYGTTSLGGANNLGTIFRINTDGSGYSKTHDFVSSTGSTPYGALVTDGSFLYGMTYNGGANNLGTMYRIAPDGASFSKLLDFNGAGNGANPYGSLKLVGSFFYGMTAKGGTNGMGTLFRIKPDGSSYAKLLDFNGATGNGSFPWGNLISEGGVLYGVTSDEENDNGIDEGTDYGTVFKYNIPPTIDSFSPATGPIGTAVTINGSNFSTTPANNIVYFGATKATVSTATATQLTVTVPSGAMFGPISVQVDGRIAYSYKAFVIVPPSVTINDCLFGPRVNYTVGASSIAAIAADFDGDGKPDFATTGRFSSILTVFRNTSTLGTIDGSTFSSPLTKPTAVDPYHLVAEDMDGDGKRDIVSCNAQSQSVSVFRNISTPGNLAFEDRVDYTVGLDPVNCQAKDVDGDGKPEILVANRFSNAVSVLKNQSTPGGFTVSSFATQVQFSVGVEPYAVDVSDFDADGKPEIIVANSVSNTVSILKNNITSGIINASSFNAPINFTVGLLPVGLAIGDIDQDDKMDIAVSTQNSSTLTVLRNTVSGSLNATSFLRQDIATDGNPTGISLADIDGDGIPEVLAGSKSANKISILKNLSTPGSISLTLATSLSTGNLPAFNQIVDIDGDNRSEVLVATLTDGTFNIFQNRPPALPPTITSFSPTTGSAGAVITITGTNFSTTPTDNTVKFNGVTAVVGSSTTTSITATVPIGGLGGPITVTVNCFTATSSTNFPAPPIISSFSPSSGSIGTTVTISGTNFSTTPANNTVTFNGITSVVTASSATSIITTVPTGATTGKISVTVGGNTAISATDFTVIGNFTTLWNLAIGGSGSTQLTFGTATSGTVNYGWKEISPGSATGSGSWNGSTLTITGLPAEATVRLEISQANFQRIIINFGADRNRLTQIQQWGTTTWTSMQNAFRGCANLQVTATDVPDLSGLTDMSGMFSFCNALNSPNNIGSWNTSAITNMSGLFSGAGAFNQDISLWNTAAVTNMSALFSSASAFNQNIGAWNTASVTNMNSMFSSAIAFNRNIGGWNTAAVTDMNSMFYSAYVFNQNISGWNTAAVTNMASMFGYAYDFNQNIGTWNTSAVTNMSRMFEDAFDFNQNIGTWNTSAVTNMTGMFIDAYAFNQNIGTWNTSSVTTMERMFDFATAFNQNISTWNTAAVTDMRGMFADASAFNQNLGTWSLNPSVLLTGMLNNSGLNCINYSATLLAWSANPSTPNGRSLGATGRQYGTNAVAARTNLISTKSWTITGDTPSGTNCSPTITVTQQPVNPNNRCEGLNFTFSTDAIGTTNITFQWQKFNTGTSLFENLSDNATYSGTNTKNLLITNVQLAQAGNYRCMIQGDLAPTVYCNTGILTVNPVPAAPSVSDGTRCGNGQVLVSASGTSDGNYIWYGSNGMSEPISGENNSTYLTPFITATTNYYVSIVNSFCESALVQVNATITPGPAAPTVTNLTNNGCGTQSFTLTAISASAGNFSWYPTPTSTSPLETNSTGTYVTSDLSSTTTYYVSFSQSTCESNRVPQTITITNPGPGGLDNSFLPAGNSPSNFSAIDDMAIQPDGKIVVNYFETAGVEYLMCRLLPDGSLDPSFDQRTISMFDGRPDVVTLQNDGKILSGGRFTEIDGIPYGRIIRLNTDGSVDGTFNTGSGFDNSVGVITTQSDTKIIMGGSFTSYAGGGANRIIRINNNGTRDTGFVIGTGFNAEVKVIVVRPDGKILVGGSFTTYNGSATAGIVLLNSDGTIDATFAPAGLTNVREIALQSDGKILLDSNEGFTRLNADGTADASFSTGSGFDAAINTIYCEPSGKILVGGDFQTVDGEARYFVARLNPNGSLDRYFNPGIGSFTWVYEILPTGTNQVFVAGYFDFWNNIPQNGIARISNACMRTPVATDNAACGPAITLSACGGFDGDYRWYTTSTGGSPISGESSSSITINNLTSTTTYYVALNDGVCESARVPVVATSLAPTPPTVTGTSSCVSGTFTLTASGASNGQYRWYTLASGGTAISGETNSTYTTGTITSSTTYYVSIDDGSCESARTPVTASITGGPAAPTVTGGAACGHSASVTLTANGGTNGEYRWYTNATGGTAIVGEVNSAFATPTITATTTYYVSINNGSCESTRTAVTATITTSPTAPTTTGSAACGASASVTLSASGGTNGEYRWYTAATGGTAITGQVNGTYTTPSITATTTYYVAINNGTCESARTSVIATINPLPAKPTITLSGSAGICSGQSVTLSAPAGFTYQWSNGATTQQITVSTAGSFTVQVNNGTCSSVSSDPVVITIITCNQPPAISTTTATTVVEGSVTINLSTLLSDPDNNLDLSTLKIVVPPSSGAIATIIGQNLVINYAGINFGGTDKLTIEVCDIAGVCVRQELSIEVGGDIIAYNGVSNNGDSKNAIFLLKYIDSLPDTKENKVSIYNRWGDPVWEGVNYDNTNVVFTGQNKNGNDLPTGTYFYKIEFASGKSSVTGYLSLKR